jgi:peptidoglycan hydrolase-like protein with peptidoglycan-binding domain
VWPDLPRAAGSAAQAPVAGALWRNAASRPLDALAVFAAAAASLAIVVNAAFLQSESRPAATVADTRPLPRITNSVAKAVETTVSAGVLTPRPAPVSPAAPPASVAPAAAPPAAERHDDPIANLIEPSPRVAAVQRALSDYGYGQIKPSGVLDSATSDAISKYESDHNWPVTGHVSDRLVSSLANMVGHPLQ